MKTLKTRFFDAQGLIIGVTLCCIGLVFLKTAGLVTGQAAGLALLLSYVLPFGFGSVFTAVAVPFLYLAWSRRGPVFTIRTILVVLGISFGTALVGDVLNLGDLDPLAAALLGGTCIGIGVLAVFRHNASTGGMTIMALVIEERTGLKAGWVQLAVDIAIFASAALVLEPAQVVWSFLAAVVMNLIILWNFDIRQAGRGGPEVKESAAEV